MNVIQMKYNRKLSTRFYNKLSKILKTMIDKSDGTSNQNKKLIIF